MFDFFDGSPNSALARTRFFTCESNRIGFEVLGIDCREFCKLVEKALRGRIENVRSEAGRIDWLGDTKRYYIRTVCPEVSQPRQREFQDAIGATLEPSRLDHIVRTGLERQASAIGLIPRQVSVTVKSVGIVELTKRHEHAYVPVVTDVVFDCNIDLKGPWSVGRLIGRGYGRIEARQ